MALIESLKNYQAFFWNFTGEIFINYISPVFLSCKLPQNRPLRIKHWTFKGFSSSKFQISSTVLPGNNMILSISAIHRFPVTICLLVCFSFAVLEHCPKILLWGSWLGLLRWFPLMMYYNLQAKIKPSLTQVFSIQWFITAIVYKTGTYTFIQGILIVSTQYYSPTTSLIASYTSTWQLHALFYLLLITLWVQLMLPIYAWVVGHPLRHE